MVIMSVTTANFCTTTKFLEANFVVVYQNISSSLLKTYQKRIRTYTGLFYVKSKNTRVPQMFRFPLFSYLPSFLGSKHVPSGYLNQANSDFLLVAGVTKSISNRDTYTWWAKLLIHEWEFRLSLQIKVK